MVELAGIWPKIRKVLYASLLLMTTGLGLFIAYHALPMPYIVPMSDVEVIERWAAHDRCVSNLSEWSRTYRFAGSAGQATPDFDEVVVWYADPKVPLPDGKIVAAGVHRPWRNSLFFGHSFVDHRQQRVASGLYDRRSSSMIYWSCGCNSGRASWERLPLCRKNSAD